MIIDFNNPAQYYNSLLPNEHKTVYRVIMNGIKEFRDEISIPPTDSHIISTVWDYIL
jgi:hypothetical protein